MTAKQDVEALIERLNAEADLCRNETADDVARLLDEAAGLLRSQALQLKRITFCEKCGASWYDDGNNGTTCPYCALKEPV